jgi:hypothetical protein
MPRHIFSAAVAWAMKADKSTFWKGHRRGGNKGEIQSPKDSVAAVKKSPGVIQRKSEECASPRNSLFPHLTEEFVGMKLKSRSFSSSG